MASAIASQAQAALLDMLATIGETATASRRKTSFVYDSCMEIVDTTTNWTSVAAFTACLQVPSQRELMKIWESSGIREKDLAYIFCKVSCAVENGDAITIGGETYYVRMAQPANKGYRRYLCSKTEGQERDG